MAQVRILLVALLLAVSVGLAQPALSHDLGLAQVTATVEPGGNVLLRAKLSSSLKISPPVLPEGCSGSAPVVSAPDRLNSLVEMRFSCRQEIGDGEIFLPWRVNGIFLIVHSNGGYSRSEFISAGYNGVTFGLDDLTVGGSTLVERPTMEVATSYVGLGIQHILLGLDHLALLLCLSMLARGMVLLRLVTAFTVGHSITLCAAALDWINVPIPPVEVLIVLSVAYLAREVWFAHRLDRSSTVLLVGIGLLHGLGFASVLSEIGLPKSDLLVALVSFNVGVEIGQVIFLGAVIGVQTALARLTAPSLRPVAQPAIALILGITAMYWTLERIAGFYA